MKMSQEQIEKSINKMITIIKPNGVLGIEFKMSPIDNDEYYFDITYIVPDDSIFLRSSNMRNSDLTKTEWNGEIRNFVKNYLGVDIIINNSGIMSESYYQKMKMY
jgi:hypothetical protein